MTFGSTFHLQYVQRLQNSRDRSLMQSWKDPTANMMSPAGLVLYPPQKSHQNLWQEKNQVLDLLLVLGIWVE